MKIRIPIFLFATWWSVVFVAQAGAQGTAFTYQGRLLENASPANGSYDIRSTLFLAASGGSPVAGPLTNSAVAVSNGLFVVLLDFGAGVFDGSDRFLEMAVRSTGSGSFSVLDHRQHLTPSPYALYASAAGRLSDGAVARVNNLQNDVTLAPGQNVTITPSGNTLTIAATSVNPWFVNGANIYRDTGDVGIGTTLPATPLHVRGTGEEIRIDGSASGAANLAYMSFRDSLGTRIGYVGDGSSGDTSVFLASDAGDVVLNTLAGRVVTAKSDGKVGIGTTTPQSGLDVRGDIKMGSSGQFFAPGAEENLRIVRGVVTATGGIIVGSGFSVSHPSSGRYTITFNTAFASAPAVTATADFTGPVGTAFVMTEGVTASSANLLVTSGGATLNAAYHFIAMGPR